MSLHTESGITLRSNALNAPMRGIHGKRDQIRFLQEAENVDSDEEMKEIQESYLPPKYTDVRCIFRLFFLLNSIASTLL